MLDFPFLYLRRVKLGTAKKSLDQKRKRTKRNLQNLLGRRAKAPLPPLHLWRRSLSPRPQHRCLELRQRQRIRRRSKGYASRPSVKRLYSGMRVPDYYYGSNLRCVSDTTFHLPFHSLLPVLAYLCSIFYTWLSALCAANCATPCG